MQDNTYKEFFNVYQYLCEQSNKSGLFEYRVPRLLTDDSNSTHLVNAGNPYSFFRRIFEQIAAYKTVSLGAGDGISTDDIIYQTYIRSFASLNYEIGTALKQIAFLPFLKKRLGITVLINLPPGVIGKTNKKGMRGSPFAIKNPFCIDTSLCDGLLSGFTPIEQYKTLIQACQMLGIRVGSIVPLTILAMDSPFFKEFPGLGYWWHAYPGELLFAKSQHKPCSTAYSIKNEIHIEDFQKLRFVEPPIAEEVQAMQLDGHTYYVTCTGQEGTKQVITLANAFPDPIAGDANNYTWKDVATIRYTHALYPPSQGSKTKPELDKSKPAWLIMPLLIAWRAQELGEDCFLIDVNENVPQEILYRAMQLIRRWNGNYRIMAEKLLHDHTCLEELRKFFDDQNVLQEESIQADQRRSIDFIAEELWNFEITNSQISVITGPLINCVSAHSHNHPALTDSLRYHLQLLKSSGSPKLYFGGVANHDTMPPCPQIVPLLYTLYHFLPRSVPMIFSGNEYYSSLIVNKEFCFSTPELQSLREMLKDEDLALFNDIPVNWSELSENNKENVVEIIPLLQSLRRMRQHLFTLVPDDSLDYRFLEMPEAPQCFGYSRERRGAWEDSISVYVNWNRQNKICIKWHKPAMKIIGIVTTNYPPADSVPGSNFELQPLSVVVLGSGLFQHLPGFKH